MVNQRLGKVPVYVWRIALILLIGLILLGCSFQSSGGEVTETTESPALSVPTKSNTMIPDRAVTVAAEPPADATLGSTWTRPADDMVMVYVPAGRFMMGSDPAIDPDAWNAEQPQHEVTLDGFWIDQTEVTNEQYERCVAVGECGPSALADDGAYNADDQPAVGVSWFEAEAYCEWAGGGLPTEAQWEYAARGEENRLYPWGNEFDGGVSNFCDANCNLDSRNEIYDDGFGLAAPVGSYPDGASWVEAYDMAGNVFEWVADWYDDYDASPTTNPTGPPGGDTKVQRGGSWGNPSVYMRSAYRFNWLPAAWTDGLGFRCAAPGPEQETTVVGEVETPTPVRATPVVAEPPVNATLGSVWTRPADDMSMVYVPAGRFMMGSDPAVDPDAKDDEQPQHEVSLDGFWIDQTEVTNGQYERCVAAGMCEPLEVADSGLGGVGLIGEDDQPVVGASWLDAEAYCTWAGGQLPTEAQWEYAARGEEGRLYPWGNDFDGDLLNFCDTNCMFGWKDENYDDGFWLIAPAGSYPDGASWVGAYDMAGNAQEWVADWYGEDYYGISPTSNPTGPPGSSLRVLRGGGWDADSQEARSANRDFDLPTFGFGSYGFRCAALEP